jgi:predicted RNase H-like HicB family nuclease
MPHVVAGYGVMVEPSEDGGGYIANVVSLPGCMAHGNTIQSALASAEEVVEAWLRRATEAGRPIPPRDIP